MDELRKAAQAVLDQWDSPAWDWQRRGPTADLMAALRAALAERCRYPDCVDNGPDGKCTRWLLAECNGPAPAVTKEGDVLSPPPLQEPVAWQCSVCGGGPLLCLHNQTDVPLYAEPLQRKPLTDKDIELHFDRFITGGLNGFARAIERAHGIE